MFPPALRLVNMDRPVNAESVLEPAHIGTPGLPGQGHLDSAAFGQIVEDLGEPVFIRAA
jgi:hypothetical protein